MNFKTVCAVALCLLGTSASAVTIQIGDIFSNAGFENGNLSGWKATKPNGNYIFPTGGNPVINPVIDPSGPTPQLVAPAGNNFVGVLNPGDVAPDENVKLVHDAVAVDFDAGDIIAGTFWANRGRLDGFTAPSTGTATVTLYGWGAGSLPTDNAANDNWSRNPTFSLTFQYDFTGQADGAWGSQLFSFILPFDVSYLSLAIVGQNHNHDQYVALDLSSAAVPDGGTTILLLSISLVAIGAIRRLVQV